MDRSGILFGIAFALIGSWTLDDSRWIAIGFFLLATLYVATAFSPCLNRYLRSPLRSRGDSK